MALYKHIANKEELLDGMVDIVFSEIELPSVGSKLTVPSQPLRLTLSDIPHHSAAPRRIAPISSS